VQARRRKNSVATILLPALLSRLLSNLLLLTSLLDDVVASVTVELL
jgi:hypothetical protein